MKNLLIAFCVLVSIAATTQDKTTVKATFEGFENEVYHFSDDAESAYVFDTLGEDASKAYDLTNKKYIGQHFKITYITETIMDEMENKIEVLTIIDLEILQKL